MDRLALQNVLHGHVSNRGEIDVSFHHLPDAGKNLWDNATLRAPVGDAADVLTGKLADSDQRLFGAMISDDGFYVGGSSQHPQPVDSGTYQVAVVVHKSDGLD